MVDMGWGQGYLERGFDTPVHGGRCRADWSVAVLTCPARRQSTPVTGSPVPRR